MAYLDVIKLDTAKNHLRIDGDFNIDDDSIERMIKSALEIIEINTSHVVYSRDKTYHRSQDAKRITVYDYPVNDNPNNVDGIFFSLRREYQADELTLNVGYDDPDDVPSALIDAALMIIGNWYYEHEKEANTSIIPEGAERILFTYKRGIVA